MKYIIEFVNNITSVRNIYVQGKLVDMDVTSQSYLQTPGSPPSRKLVLHPYILLFQNNFNIILPYLSILGADKSILVQWRD